MEKIFSCFSVGRHHRSEDAVKLGLPLSWVLGCIRDRLAELRLSVQVEQVCPASPGSVGLACRNLLLLGVLRLNSTHFFLRQTELMSDFPLPPLMIALTVLLLDEDEFFELASVRRVLLLVHTDSTAFEEVKCHHGVGFLLVRCTSKLFLGFGGALARESLLLNLKAAQGHKFARIIATSLETSLLWSIQNRRWLCCLLFITHHGHLS